MLTVEPVPQQDDAILKRLTSFKTIGANAIWQTAGRIIPMAVALVLTPRLIAALGVDQWGIFTLALTLVGAFGVFDLGIGRALTRNVAFSIGGHDRNELASQVKTSLLMMLLLGVLGGLLLAAAIDIWATSYLKLPILLIHEAKTCFLITCSILPLVVINSGLWGVLSAFQMQKLAFLWSTPIAILYYLGPLAIFQATHSLTSAFLVLLLLRLCQTWVCWHLCAAAIPGLAKAPINIRSVRPIVKLSAWMTVSNLVWPLLTYLDRLVIATLISVAAAGYYSTSGDLISRVMFLPGVIGSTAFPAISTSQRSGVASTSRLMKRTFLAVIVVTFPIALALGLLGNELLSWWLGAVFASHSSPFLRWFSLGLTFFAADTLVAGFIDALGHPRANAMFSMGELILFIPVLGISVMWFGLQGAAIAWFVRVAADVFFRISILQRLTPALRSQENPMVITACLTTALAPMCFLPLSFPLRALALCVGLTCFSLAIWTCALTSEERKTLRQRIAWSW